MPMTPELRRSIDRIRDYLFGGGYPNPAQNAEQLSFLIYFCMYEAADAAGLPTYADACRRSGWRRPRRTARNRCPMPSGTRRYRVREVPKVHVVTGGQMSLDLARWPSGRVILDRIRAESRDESEKGRWFEQLFMRIAIQQPEFEIAGIWRWPDWPKREALTGLDGRDFGMDLVARRTSGEMVAIQCKCYEDRHTFGKGQIGREGRRMDQAIASKSTSARVCI